MWRAHGPLERRLVAFSEQLVSHLAKPVAYLLHILVWLKI